MVFIMSDSSLVPVYVGLRWPGTDSLRRMQDGEKEEKGGNEASPACALSALPFT
jgi:hypothetical protein